ncbi:MAG: hypothetical protein A2189_06400, partial [Paenibacillus sp. RIFOXYA1_FULL_44_5]
MFHLLIVDDEMYAVEGLKFGLNWSSHGFSEIYESYNVEMAKKVFQQTGIDLMICDIEMPKGNGLQLLEWVNEHYPETLTVFLTCHAEFSYAQKALQLGSINYLVKPVIFAELERIVLNVLETIRKEREASQAQQSYQKYYQLWETRKPLLIERFWQDLFGQRISGRPDFITSELAAYDLDLSTSFKVMPILISVEKWHKELSTRDEEVMEYALRNAAAELILGEMPGLVFQDRSGINFVLIYAEKEGGVPYQELKGSCETYIKACNNYFYCNVSCYIGKYVSISEVLNTYHELITMERNNINRSNIVMAHDDQKHDLHSLQGQLPDFFAWAELIEEDENEQLLLVVKNSVDKLKCDARANASSLQAYYQGFLQMIYYIFHKRGLSAPVLFEKDPIQLLTAPKTISQMEEWVHQIIAQVIGKFMSGASGETVIGRVKKYILDNVHEEITREQLAEYVHLNPGYLSRLFKKETGESLTDCILRERMEVARDMLLQSDIPVSQIATSLGYTHFSHFTRMFKRVYLMNPQDFRKKLIS